MGRNILIFADGTGQAGGLLPDELRSNVYKLYRATRCGPDTNIDPANQIAFYDPGLGSQTDSTRKIGIARRVENFFSSAMGLGITRNIIDCYTAILTLWRPGDRVWLFGFSRGAYTARCVGGVLGACGVPEHMEDGSPLRRDPQTIRRIAMEAVKDIYQHGTSIRGDPFKPQRLQRAFEFRRKYGCGTDPGSPSTDRAKTVPYFIGVWDTVAAIGAPLSKRVLVGAVALAVTIGLAAIASWLLSYVVLSFLPLFYALSNLVLLTFVVWLLKTHLRFHADRARPYWAAWRMTFYDRYLNPNVKYAMHAISIDENRKDFARVEWIPSGQRGADGSEPRLIQLWFAGNHSDVGGSYSENESRLSDIALQWMIEKASTTEFPIFVDPAFLRLFPGPDGMQHDECKVGVPLWFGRRFEWTVGHRYVPHNAPVHPSVEKRLGLTSVLCYGEEQAYRPEALRIHEKFADLYAGVPPSTCECDACRRVRGLPPIPSRKERLQAQLDKLSNALKRLTRRS